MYHRKGFTLLELSIVLVIVGLVLGGVLVARDMIKAAELRSQINQLSKYSAASNTFRIKFNYLPADLPNATQLGFYDYTTPPWDIKGHRNGLINDYSGAAPPISLWGENYVFFDHLSTAGMVDQVFAYQPGVYNWESEGASKQFPKAKVGRGGIMPMSYNHNLYWYLGLNKGTIGGGSDLLAAYSDAGTLAPTDAHALDTKLDDGKPGSGTVISVTNASATLDIADGGCVKNSATEYNTLSTLQCRLLIRAQ